MNSSDPALTDEDISRKHRARDTAIPQHPAAAAER
jgi:hypothetical protein